MKDCPHTTDEQDAALLTGACPLCLGEQLVTQERENNRLTFALKRIQINSRGGPTYDIVEKTLSQELIDLRGLLRRIEWADADEHGVGHCPACGQAQMNGHAGDCELAMKKAQ